MPKKQISQKVIQKSKVLKKDVSANICKKHHFQASDVNEIQKNLLDWYDKSQRILPWREIAKKETDNNVRGYAVWVSEIMLQQTQVATVIPYYNKWLKKWPTVQNLAAANLEEVLQMWAGLGYYSRGRRLHDGANIVVNKLNGIIPDTVTELMKSIPGIGAYSASAIASVAFQKVTGVVDGNVIRVLSRMRVIGANVSQPGVRDHLWNLANLIVSKERPGDFNQALMELGAVICTPQNPDCTKCPVSSCCSVFNMAQESAKSGPLSSFLKDNSSKTKEKISEVPDIENILDCDFCLSPSIWKTNPQVTAFPCKVEKKSARKEKVNVIVVKSEDKFLIVRRPEKGLLAGLWEFPSLILNENISQKSSNKNILNMMKEDFGIPPPVLSKKQFIGEVVHLFSHIHTTYVVDYLDIEESTELGTSNRETKWILEKELKTEAISTAMKKVFALLKKAQPSPKNKVGSKKRKLSSDVSKQTSIKSFFRKS